MQRPASTAPVALVLESDDHARQLASALLEETELAVEESRSAEDALSFLSSHADEVALLMADAEAAGDLACEQLARLVSGRWPWISILITASNPAGLSDDLPRGATLMPKPWRALDVLVQADKAARAVRQMPH